METNCSVAVVVAVNNETQFNGFIMASPGLKELNTKIIPVRGAKSAAEAFYKGIQETICPWIIYCHQDVFFPKGTGRKIEKRIYPLSKDTILGFAGLAGKLNSDSVEGVGSVYSGKSGFLNFPSKRTDAISLDEFVIVLNRECKYKIDPKLGWHLWGTDLCLQAALDGFPAKVERLLLTHYSSHEYIGDGGVPVEFHDSKEALIKKYPQLDVFHSLCTSWHRYEHIPKRDLRRVIRPRIKNGCLQWTRFGR